MKFLLVVSFTFSLLSGLPDFGFGLIAYTSIHYQDAINAEPSGSVTCTCDGSSRTVELPKNDLQGVFMNIMHQKHCSPNISSEICDLVNHCSHCSATLSACEPSSNERYSCVNKRVRMYSTPGEDDHGGRVKRSRRECNFPRHLITSNVECTEHLTQMKCTQKCIYGYTLEEGIARDMVCNYTENVWKPKGFEECEPFMDCTLNLIAGGKLECYTATPYNPPRCIVSCDKPPVNATKYRCVSGKEWDKELPDCVETGSSGIYLVPAPKHMKLHYANDLWKEKLLMKKKRRKTQLMLLRMAGLLPEQFGDGKQESTERPKVEKKESSGTGNRY